MTETLRKLSTNLLLVTGLPKTAPVGLCPSMLLDDAEATAGSSFSLLATMRLRKRIGNRIKITITKPQLLKMKGMASLYLATNTRQSGVDLILRCGISHQIAIGRAKPAKMSQIAHPTYLKHRIN